MRSKQCRPDQMPHNVASVLSLHCFLVPVCPNTYGKYCVYTHSCLMLSMLGKIFSRRHTEISFSYFFPENRFWHFTQTVSTGSCGAIMFSGKNKEIIIGLSSAESAQRVVKVTDTWFWLWQHSNAHPQNLSDIGLSRRWQIHFSRYNNKHYHSIGLFSRWQIDNIFLIFKKVVVNKLIGSSDQTD